MSFADQAYLAQHPGFQNRVRVAMVKTAVAVGSDLDDGSETARLRRAHTVNVLSQQDDWAPRYAWAVVTNSVITFDSPDDAIEFTVNSMFNAMAGAPPTTPGP